MLNIKQLPVGMGQANCYIISNKTEALIIDPGAEHQVISHYIDELDVQPIAILLTHTHYDHIGALEKIRETYAIPVYVSSKEQSWLKDSNKNLSAFVGHPITANQAEYELNPTETLNLSDFTFKVVPTPGHSPGGVSFIFEKGAFVLTGDALFAGSVGRTDLPGSNPDALFAGIKEQLFSLPEEYTIYPGHGEPSTIGTEKQTNPFFQ